MSSENRKAATAELREFLAQMRGKSPKEMLGAIASSNLAQSTFVAIATVTAAIAVLTIVPFGLEKAFGDSDGNSSPDSQAEAQQPDKPIESPAEPDLDGATDADAANTLGIGESKSAPANVNPLESATDDLLEGLE